MRFLIQNCNTFMDTPEDKDDMGPDDLEEQLSYLSDFGISL